MATTTSQINEIKGDLSDAYTALGAKGATLPESNARGTANLASTIATVPAPDPVNKAFDVDNGVLDKPKNITFSEDTFAGVTSIGSYSLYNVYSYQSNKASNPGGVVKFDSVTSVGECGLQNAFKNCNITSVYFNSLTKLNSTLELSNAFFGNTSLTSILFQSLASVYGSYTLQSCFNRCTSLSSISFPALTSVSGNYSFRSCFNGCTSLTSVSFPELTTINTAYGSDCFDNCFNGCTSLTSVSFPKLKEMGRAACPSMFYGCTSLSSVDLSSLESMENGSINNMFYGCKGLTTISFPSLTNITQHSFGNAFSGCTNLTEIHFPAAMQTDIEATQSYSTKWGATNATIYFDL